MASFLKPYEIKQPEKQVNNSWSLYDKSVRNAPVFGVSANGNTSGNISTPKTTTTTPATSTTKTTTGLMSPGYTPLDFSKLGTYSSPISDWTAYRDSLVTSGANTINKTYDTAGNNMRDNLGGGGLYGSSIYGDVATNLASEKANALSTNEANASTQTMNAQLQDAAQQNAFTQWLGSLLASENQSQNTYNLDTWKSQLEADTTKQGWEFDANENLKNRLWQTGENDANRTNQKNLQTDQQTWQSGENTLNRDQANNILDKTQGYDLEKLDKQNTYDLGKLDKTFTHDDTTLQKTQDFQKWLQEYLYGNVTQTTDPTTGEVAPTYTPGVNSAANTEQAILNYIISSMLQKEQIAGNKEIANIEADSKDSASMWSAGGSIAGAVIPSLLKKYV